MKIALKIIVRIVLVLVALGLLGAILPPPKPPVAGELVTLPNGIKINTFTKGEGKSIVLVHGLPGSANDWPELVDALVAKDFQVTWYDRVGYGHSSRRGADADFTMQANADELDALIAVLGLENPALVGWSFGGGIVQSSKTARKAETPFIVLLAAVAPTMKLEGKRDQMRGLTLFVRMPILGSIITRASISARFAETMPKRWVDVQRSLLLTPGTLDTFRGEMNNMVPSTLTPGDIQTPTLIIHGTKDPMVPYRVGQKLNEVIAGSKLVALDGVGHMIPLSHPKEIADAIVGFSGNTSEE